LAKGKRIPVSNERDTCAVGFTRLFDRGVEFASEKRIMSDGVVEAVMREMPEHLEH